MSDQRKCIVCQRLRVVEECHILTLTDLEKQHIRERGQTPADEVTYCRPCYRLITDKHAGADVLTGMLLQRLKAAGAQNADKLAAKFKEQLVKAMKEKKN